MGFIVIQILRALGWAYYLAPAPLKALWARSLGWVFRRVGFRAKVVDDNLRRAYSTAMLPRVLRHGDASAFDQARIRKEAYRHFGRLILEVAMVFGPLKRYCERSVDVVGFESWQAAHALGKGVIFVSSHVGNWELMAAKGGLMGTDLMMVTKRLKPEWFHRAIECGRLKCGTRATYEPRTLKDILGHLKRNGTVGIVLDQYVGPPVGVRVPFFGVPVGTASLVATIARRTGAAILPVVNFQGKDGRFKIEIEPPVPWIPDSSPERELAVNTAHYSQIIERHVLEHPDQWLWIHRRFKGDLSPLRPGEWEEGRARA